MSSGSSHLALSRSTSLRISPYVFGLDFFTASISLFTSSWMNIIKGNLVIIKPKGTCKIIIWLSVKKAFNQALLPIDWYLYCYADILMVKRCNVQSWMCIVSIGQTVKRHQFKYLNTLRQTGFSSKRKWSTDNCGLTKRGPALLKLLALEP